MNLTLYFGSLTSREEGQRERKNDFNLNGIELAALFPDIVFNAGTDPSIPRVLEYDAFIAMLVERVQRQERRIQALEERGAQLEKVLQS